MMTLQTPQPSGREHCEVSREAVQYYQNYYPHYRQHHLALREQACSPGFCLVSPHPGRLNTAGDVLTSQSAFRSLQSDPELSNLHRILLRIYHTHGNLIPWPEGGNFSRGGYGRGESYHSNDNYYLKLLDIKEIFEHDPQEIYAEYSDTGEQLIQKVRNDLEALTQTGKKYYSQLRRMSYRTIYYWVKTEWEGASWEDFVAENYLRDFVDENLNPLPFSTDATLPTTYSLNPVLARPAILQVIRGIVRRGYRIENGVTGDLGVADRVQTEACLRELLFHEAPAETEADLESSTTSL